MNSFTVIIRKQKGGDMGALGNLNIIEILKLGLPGIVFILSLLSYRLLSQEQKKKDPSYPILRSIRCYMYVNILLALLTAFGPFIEAKYTILSKNNIYSVKAKLSETQLNKGEARVCNNAKYSGRFLLLKDTKTGRLIQVEAKVIMPCKNDELILISEEDVEKLGWTDPNECLFVEVVAAEKGQKFCI
jgi:hypothetical protein